ncbi:hypothetical protein [Agromyces laixinhei]|uniref:hypothetical protein n=1 Tax=Agromyces laixinhei TaxID=2585717 RepID=UPI00143D0DDF|nr:hypothetical protein [Agromyces laixinhei]
MRRVRTVIGGGLLAASLAFGLSACGQTPEAVSASLHASVVQVAERAEVGDYLGAIAALALLENDVTAAVDDGAIDADKAADIRAALALVRADLEAAETAGTPTPSPTTGGDDTDGDRNDEDKQGNRNDKKNDNDKKTNKNKDENDNGSNDTGNDDRGNGNEGNDRYDDD